MVGYPILDAELAKPPIGQIDLHLGAQPPLRADRKHVAHNQHPDHQHRIDRGPTGVRIVRRKLLVHPIKIEHASDLPDQMIGRYHLVEIERIKELALPPLSPPIIGRSRESSSYSTESRFIGRLNESFATQSLH